MDDSNRPSTCNAECWSSWILRMKHRGISRLFSTGIRNDYSLIDNCHLTNDWSRSLTFITHGAAPPSAFNFDVQFWGWSLKRYSVEIIGISHGWCQLTLNPTDFGAGYRIDPGSTEILVNWGFFGNLLKSGRLDLRHGDVVGFFDAEADVRVDWSEVIQVRCLEDAGGFSGRGWGKGGEEREGDSRRIFALDNGELQKYPQLAAPSFYFRNVATIQLFIFLHFPLFRVCECVSVCVTLPCVVGVL